jgi:transcriptional regulator with XRE-family HTH domain
MIESTQILKILGRRIATLRKQKGMNQEEFADVSGKMINTISNIERGLSDPKVTTLLSMAQALNVSVDMLFNEESPQGVEKLPENVLAIVKLIKNQDNQTLRIIQRQIEALLELKFIEKQ